MTEIRIVISSRRNWNIILMNRELEEIPTIRTRGITDNDERVLVEKVEKENVERGKTSKKQEKK